jgi:hypothetical protein
MRALGDADKVWCGLLELRGDSPSMIGRNRNLVSNFAGDIESYMRISPDFYRRRCVKMLKKCADTAKDYGTAIGYYSSVLSLRTATILLSNVARREHVY